MTRLLRSTVQLLAVLTCGCLLAGCPRVTVIPDDAILEVGQTIGISAESTNPNDTSFTWTTSDAGIVALNSDTGTEITITATGAGTATITATGSSSGIKGQVLITVPTETGEGEGEGEPIIIPGGQLAPGLNVQINKVVIPADLKPEVTFTATDDKGNLVARSEISDVRFILAYLTPGQNGSTNRFTSYTTSIEDPDKVPNSGDEAVQATYDSVRLNGLSQNSDGAMLYKFARALPAAYNKSLTHQLGGQLTRVYAINGQSYPANPVFDFCPDGAAVSELRQIAGTATCNNCHTRLGLHGGNRREIQLCILCHTPQTTDANTGNTVDMPVLIHKIHMGEQLPSVAAGQPYRIIGFGNSVNDYSTVAFPQDIRHCTACHDSAQAPQADTYLKKPTRAGCGSCHDRTWFGKKDQTPEGYHNHPFNFEQPDDSGCAVCHIPSGEDLPAILESHLTPTESPEAPGLEIQIVPNGVVANPEDGTLSVTFTAKYGNGSPITAVTTDPVLQRLGFVVAWPASDYQNSVSESIRSSGAMPGTLDSNTSDTGAYTYTFNAKPPTGTGDIFGIAATGRVAFEFKGEEHEQGVKSNSLTFFTLDGSQAEPRRDVVADVKCNKCHYDLRAHGEQRVGVGLCVMCHRPNASAAEGDTAVTINLKDMLHRFHTGENLENPYAIGSFDANEVRFPGDRRQCTICHDSGTQLAPLPEGVLPTVVKSGETVVSETQPTRAACTSCHDGVLPNVHAILATSPPPDNIETCEICHGLDAEFAVATVHTMGN